MKNILKRAVRKVVKPKLPYRRISDNSILPLVKGRIARSDKEHCLDIGCGNDPVEGCSTLDILERVKPDFCGDVRELFAPGYTEKIDSDSPLLEIPESYYKVVVLHHIIEHIEWIYTDFLMRWVFSILDYGGMVSIDTPNLDFVVKVYMENMKRIMAGEQPSYPIHEHIYCKEGIPWHVVKWFDFKAYSGCSPGDYHHAMFNAYALGNILAEQGFEKIGISDTGSLRAIAYKPSILNGSTGTDDFVAATLGDR